MNQFESVADEVDKSEAHFSGCTEKETKSIKAISRPYLVATGFEDGVNYVFTMNPLMSQVLVEAEFVEADITFNETNEYPRLLNMVAFSYTMMEWVVVSRVRIHQDGAKAHEIAFSKTFQRCKADHPKFDLDTTLLGIVTD